MALSTNAASSIRLAVILGTTRPESFTSRAVALVLDELKKHDHVGVDYIDPVNFNLACPGQPITMDKEKASAEDLQSVIKNATAVIFATPEYHGCFAACTKMIIENLGFPSVLSGKPVALLGVAAGQIGAIKSLETLRGCISHTGGLVLPGSISIPSVRSVFNDKGECTDAKVEALIRKVPTTVLNYLNNHVCPKFTLEAIVRGEPVE